MKITPSLALLCTAIACSGTAPPMGDEQLGLYDFRAEPSPPDGGWNTCGPTFREIPDGGFGFQAYFSRFKDAGTAFVTIGGVGHLADFDGQVIHASYSAQRNFIACSCPDSGVTRTVTMTETFTATIVSRSQSDAIGGCAANPPVDPDAGITRPMATSTGFDAVKACGTLTEQITISPPVTGDDPESCSKNCNGCGLSYTILGDRK